MLTLFTLPGRALMRIGGQPADPRATGVLPAALSILVYLLVAALVVWGIRHPTTPARTATIASAYPDAVLSPSAPPVVAPVVPASAASDPGGFAPLQSQAVKDAIHRALVTGATQRWQDGMFSGYAVPSLTAGANGCRAIRYTVDQHPDAPYGAITACDASAPR